jgi:ABC-type bacteriocin/lantibiotic exporter with double-glycine peptidase domain
MTAGIVAIIWVGGQSVIAGALTVGAFVAYLELFGRFVARSYRIPQLVNSVQSGAAAYVRLEPFLAPPLAVAGEPAFASFRPNRLPGMLYEPELPAASPTHPVEVTIRNASFRYPGAAEPAFQDISLEISAGAFVAITGPVGSGKSALARCLAGLYPLESGEILLEGVSSSELRPGVVGYAPQDGFLISGSVSDNVFLGSLARPTDLERLLDLASMRDDVAALPHAHSTPIGELGVRISGGQRQRLSLARAAAASPGLLVLDDPFSAVDIDTEAQIVTNLRRAFGPGAPPAERSTIVLFSHRLGAFPLADMVVVLERGHVAEQGTHAALLSAGGLYARIYRAQRRVEGAAQLVLTG